jgi:hypothetical protein
MCTKSTTAASDNQFVGPILRIGSSLLVIALALASLVFALAGPRVAWFVGVFDLLFAGIVLGCIHLGFNHHNKKRRLTPLVAYRPSVGRYRLLLRITTITVAAVMVLSIFTLMFFSAGVGHAPDDFEALLAERDTYRLGSGGEYAPVPRWRFLVVTCSFMLGWHCGLMMAGLLALRLSLFGRRECL